MSEAVNTPRSNCQEEARHNKPQFMNAARKINKRIPDYSCLQSISRRLDFNNPRVNDMPLPGVFR